MPFQARRRGTGEIMPGQNNKIINHTAIYMFGDILRYSVSLIMLPIYTRFLTTEDYGTIELLNMLIDFATILFGARVAESVFRFYNKANTGEEKKSIISSALFMSFSFNGLGALTVAVFSGPLAVAIYSDASYSHFIVLMTISMLMLPLTELPLIYIRAEQKPWLFFTFSLAKLVLQVSLNLYLVVWKEMHVDGVLYSSILSSAVMGTLLSSYTLYRNGIHVRYAICRKLMVFSLPLKLATVGTFYLTFGDRYILNQFRDLSEVGIYALGYKFGFIFTLLAWTPFEKLWGAERYLVHEKADARQTFQRVFQYISFLLILLGLAISVYAKDLLRIMSAPAFWDASAVVPVIIVAYIFQAWTKYCNFGLMLHHRTMQIAYAELVASAAITVAYLLLIPAFGMHGAAWATVLGFMVRFYWTYTRSTRLYDMELPWRKILLTMLFAGMCYLLTFALPENLLASIALRSVIMLVFIGGFFTLPILTRDEKTEIVAKFRRLVRR
jgi:O-antigen/teichoic acid export membrane protein